ncbi:MAG TPA: phage holin family protein [Verrucomicrobiae bacterium]|nr:phage holin family protein [Verrucomicrobiae bacterium]
MDTRTMQQPLPELIRELRDETGTLVAQKIALAKAEITEKGRRLGKNAISIAAGLALAYAGLILLLLAVRDLLFSGMVDGGVSVGVALWLAPLIVGLVVGVIGWVLVNQGKKKLSDEGIKPEKTVQSLREEKNWLKHKIAHS